MRSYSRLVVGLSCFAAPSNVKNPPPWRQAAAPTRSMCLSALLSCIRSGCCSAGQLLYDLGHAIDNKRVQAKPPQQSIACTKSYHGLRDLTRVCEALHRLVFALWPRLLEVSACDQSCCCMCVVTQIEQQHRRRCLAQMEGSRLLTPDPALLTLTLLTPGLVA